MNGFARESKAIEDIHIMIGQSIMEQTTAAGVVHSVTFANIYICIQWKLAHVQHMMKTLTCLAQHAESIITMYPCFINIIGREKGGKRERGERKR